MMVPKELVSLQTWFGNLIARPIQGVGRFNLPLLEETLALEAEVLIRKGAVLQASEGMAIYNQQYWFRLLGVLQEAFPALLRLFGYESFNKRIAEPYLLAHPPGHWSLSFLGRLLPAWLEAHYQEEDRELVCSMAAIDEAYHRVFDVEEKRALSSGEEQLLLHHPLFLQPFVAPIALQADLFSFRAKLMEQKVEHFLSHDFPPLLWDRPCYFVLHRNGTQIRYEEISSEEYFFLHAFEKGGLLEEVCDQFAGAFPQADAPIADWFQSWTQKGWLFLHP